VTAPERQDRSVDSVEWAAVDGREKIVRFPTRSEPVLSRNGGFGATPEARDLRSELLLSAGSRHKGKLVSEPVAHPVPCPARPARLTGL